MSLLKLSIIIPCLNEAENIVASLKPLQIMRQRGHEIILCDAGSNDNTVQLSQPWIDHCSQSARGRAVQMNAGANLANGDVLCFLHADTLAQKNIDSLILDALNQQTHKEKSWGFFSIKLSSPRWQFRIIEWLINTRSCLSRIATGDQGLFIKHELFKELNGFAEIPLMEDIELSKRLKKISPPVCIKKHKLITSSRRWEKHGILRTILLMWKLRFAYFLGAPESRLAKAYKNHVKNK